MNRITLQNFKKDKLLGHFFLPFLIIPVIILVSFIFNQTEEKFLQLINMTGIFVVTIGTVFAIRPIIRKLLNPNTKGKENKKRDINSGLISFTYIIVGFAMQLVYNIYILFLPKTIPDFLGINSWIVITLLLDIITFKILMGVFKDLNSIKK